MEMCKGWVEEDKTDGKEEQKPEAVVGVQMNKVAPLTVDEEQERSLSSIHKAPLRTGAHGGVVSVEIGEGSTLDEPSEENNNLQSISRAQAPHKTGAHGGVVGVETAEGNTLDETPDESGLQSIKRAAAPRRTGAHGGVVSVEVGEGSTLDES